MKRINFEFRGIRHWYACGEGAAPHLPHEIGQYTTVRYGVLQNYCCGASGDGIDIVCLSEYDGSVATPDHWCGFALVDEEK